MTGTTTQDHQAGLAAARSDWADKARSKRRVLIATVRVEVITQPPHGAHGTLVLLVPNRQLDGFIATVVRQTAHLKEVRVSCLVPTLPYGGIDTLGWGLSHAVWQV